MDDHEFSLSFGCDRNVKRLQSWRPDQDSVLIRADHLAASLRRERLIDAESRWSNRESGRGRVESHVDRLPVGGASCHDWIVSLMNLTEPSQKAKLAPPGW